MSHQSYDSSWITSNYSYFGSRFVIQNNVLDKLATWIVTNWEQNFLAKVIKRFCFYGYQVANVSWFNFSMCFKAQLSLISYLDFNAYLIYSKTVFWFNTTKTAATVLYQGILYYTRAYCIPLQRDHRKKSLTHLTMMVQCYKHLGKFFMFLAKKLGSFVILHNNKLVKQ